MFKIKRLSINHDFKKVGGLRDILILKIVEYIKMPPFRPKFILAFVI